MPTILGILFGLSCMSLAGMCGLSTGYTKEILLYASIF